MIRTWLRFAYLAADLGAVVSPEQHLDEAAWVEQPTHGLCVLLFGGRKENQVKQHCHSCQESADVWPQMRFHLMRRVYVDLASYLNALDALVVDQESVVRHIGLRSVCLEKCVVDVEGQNRFDELDFGS